MTGMIFHHPDPAAFAKNGQERIVPLFLPFAGCPQRCIYCAPEIQGTLGAVYAGFEANLAERWKRFSARLEAPFGVAFYGGTFTALPPVWQERFLALAAGYKEQGMITHIRCSTRPDAITEERLAILARSGLDMVELGVQSFDTKVLNAAGRGYSGQCALEACRKVRASGLGLGVQLLPGLPESTEAVFRDDVQIACRVRPDAVRIYPCLVFPDTELAAHYAAGLYTPWTLQQAVGAVGAALVLLWENAIPVIRTGIAHDPVLAEQLLAGPYHPAFGNMARGHALLMMLSRKMEQLEEKGTQQRKLFAPARFQGEFWGYKGELKEAYARTGLSPATVFWWRLPVFCLW